MTLSRPLSAFETLQAESAEKITSYTIHRRDKIYFKTSNIFVLFYLI